MYKDLERELERLGPRQLDVVEISGEQWGHLPWRSHTTLDFPAFDLCAPPAEFAAFDVVVCDQVLEHVKNPLEAVRLPFRTSRGLFLPPSFGVGGGL